MYLSFRTVHRRLLSLLNSRSLDATSVLTYFWDMQVTEFQ